VITSSSRHVGPDEHPAAATTARTAMTARTER
jgi:hypothetical protein